MADTYTKTVLTVIAACLVWLCMRQELATTPAVAQAGQPVRVVGPVHVILAGVDEDAFKTTPVPVVVRGVSLRAEFVADGNKGALPVIAK